MLAGEDYAEIGFGKVGAECEEGAECADCGRLRNSERKGWKVLA